MVYGSLAVLAAVYSWIEVSRARGLASAGAVTVVGGHPAIAEWGLVVLAALLFLAIYAVVCSPGRGASGSPVRSSGS